MTPEVEARIERGREDARAGRTVPWETVRDEVNAVIESRGSISG